MNQVQFFGRLTRDPELRHTASGDAVADFSLALNESYYNKDGEKVEKVTFVDCFIWGKRAEALTKYSSKGNQLLVNGSVDVQQWEKDGENRRAVKFKIHDFEFVGGGTKEEKEDKKEESPKPAKSKTTKKQTSKPAEDDDDDDIPF